MWKHELKKVVRHPVFICLFIILISAKIVTAQIYSSAKPESLADQIICERYLGMTIEEALPRILEDGRKAQELANKSLYETYQNGEITLAELREWENTYPERLAQASALDALLDRADTLMRYSDMRDHAKSGDITNEMLYWTKAPDQYLRLVGRWKALSLIPERGWELYFQLERMGWISFILIFFLIPQFTELRDSGMESLLKGTGRGLILARRIKEVLSVCGILVMWLIDSLLNIMIPMITYGLTGFGWAAQSLSELAQMPYPLSIGGYLPAAVLLRLAGCLIVYGLCRIISKLIRQTTAALGTALCVWGASELLLKGIFSPNLMFYPAEFLCRHIMI
ncbi:MAG: hypothetical protein ACOX63_11735 [Christensenellales bacterium]|jgi:hypothetical protein